MAANNRPQIKEEDKIMEITIFTYIGVFVTVHWFVFRFLPLIEGEHR